MDQPGTLLSHEVGRRVTSYDGSALGRVVDMTVSLGPDRPPVRRLLVQAGRSSGYLVPARDLERVPDKVAQTAEMVASNAAHLARLLTSQPYPG